MNTETVRQVLYRMSDADIASRFRTARELGNDAFAAILLDIALARGDLRRQIEELRRDLEMADRVSD